jgi:cytochrome P450
MTVRADLTSQDYFRDPAATIARLREAAPIVEVRLPIIGKVWMTTTYELADLVLKDSETFRLRKKGGSLAGVQWWMPRIIRTLAANMLTMDEPDHSRLRGIVDEAFRRRAVLDMEPRIQELARELADELCADGSPSDLVDRYARKLPLSVICELLGLPLADRPMFMAWTNSVTRISSAIGFLRMIPRLLATRRYLEHRLNAAPQNGGEGLIADLVRVEKEGGRISPAEMLSTVFLLLFAGHETTTHLISGSSYELLRNPGLRNWLAEDWSRAAGRRGVPAVRLARADLQAALRAQGHGALRCHVEEGRQDHGHAGGCQHGSARQCASAQARPREKAEPASRLRERHPFLSRPSACARRRQMRPGGPLPALAEARAGRGRIADSLVRAPGHQGDQSIAGRGRPCMTAVGFVVSVRRPDLFTRRREQLVWSRMVQTTLPLFTLIYSGPPDPPPHTTARAV